MMHLFTNFIPLVLVIACGRLSDSAAITDRDQLINCSFSPNDILATKGDPSHDKCCCTTSGKCTTYLSTTHKCNQNTGEIRPLHHQAKFLASDDTATNNDLSINCSFSPNDILTNKSNPSHDKCCCTSSGECTTYLSTTHNCNHNTGEIRPLTLPKKNITTNNDLSINCSFSPNDISTTKKHPSHDKCCCTRSGECTTYLSTTHNCNPDTAEIRPLTSAHPKRKPLDTSGSCKDLSDDEVCCERSITSFSLPKEDDSHDSCCCDEDDEDGTTCTSYAKAEHVCKDKGQLVSLRKTGAWCPGFSSTKSLLPYKCCRNGAAYLPDVMSCNFSSGEVTLKSSATFESLKLCRKKLPRALDNGPAPAIHNKEIHLEGRVDKVRVDIGANYLIIDLLPFRFNRPTKTSACSRQGRGRLQVRVMLHPKGWCQPLDEVQEYLIDKTLDIWMDVQSLGHCRPKRLGFQIPYLSKDHWMMVSRRDFYLKQ